MARTANIGQVSPIWSSGKKRGSVIDKCRFHAPCALGNGPEGFEWKVQRVGLIRAYKAAGVEPRTMTSLNRARPYMEQVAAKHVEEAKRKLCPVQVASTELSARTPLRETLELYLASRKGVKRGQTTTTQESYRKTWECRVFPILPPDRPIGEFTEAQIAAWRTTLLGEDLSPGYINSCLKLIKALFTWTTRLEVIRRNPAARVEFLSEPKTNKIKYWRIDQVSAFFAGLDTCLQRRDPYTALTQRAIARTILHAGLRMCEIRGLTLDGVNLDGNFLHLYRSFQGRAKEPKDGTKDGRFRHVPIIDPLIPHLVDYRDNCRPAALWAARRRVESGEYGPWLLDLFFLERTGKPIDHTRVHRTWVAAAKAAPIPADGGPIPLLSPHGGRHSFASNFVINGGPLFSLQKLLGHKNPETTQIYAHLDPRAAQVKSFIPTIPEWDG